MGLSASAGLFGFPIVIVIAIITQSWLPIAAAALILLLASIIEFHLRPMVPANIDLAKNRHVALLVALLGLLSYLIYNAFV